MLPEVSTMAQIFDSERRGEAARWHVLLTLNVYQCCTNAIV